MEEHDMVIGLLNHDETQLNAIMDAYTPLLWAIAAKYITPNTGQSKEDIEELISDVYLRLWRNPTAYDASKGSLKTYLGMMTRSMALNKLKSRERHDSVELETDMLTTLSKEEQDMDWDLFFHAVMSLEEPTREIIIKRYFFDMKPSEIQKATGLDAKQIDNRLYYGKKQVIKKFDLLGG